MNKLTELEENALLTAHEKEGEVEDWGNSVVTAVFKSFGLAEFYPKMSNGWGMRLTKAGHALAQEIRLRRDLETKIRLAVEAYDEGLSIGAIVIILTMQKPTQAEARLLYESVLMKKMFTDALSDERYKIGKLDPDEVSSAVNLAQIRGWATKEELPEFSIDSQEEMFEVITTLQKILRKSL